MNGATQVVWLVSAYDLREHAFADVTEGQGFLQALCTHSVPPDKVSDQSRSELKLARCMPCLLNLGEALADQQQGDERWGDRG